MEGKGGVLGKGYVIQGCLARSLATPVLLVVVVWAQVGCWPAGLGQPTEGASGLQKLEFALKQWGKEKLFRLVNWGMGQLELQFRKGTLAARGV